MPPHNVPLELGVGVVVNMDPMIDPWQHRQDTRELLNLSA